ncbi:hypothetical protein FNW52_10830 [Flavobacterium sp. ZT3R18]|uniref:hypothetical protein n=1 Tax=Flavobacterium sp. ZT3R18 TaxID=2594429 RepID=UPI00117A7F11|nr:hypothetical protein [Flavobacterium sp. ZT3R18]TRX35526.1 hypothetical protein FNW52_10830 [Flavobacterium sp. ZT3R18]
MNAFEYEISGIANVNRILPPKGNWCYHFLKNGNIRIRGKPLDANFFSSMKFEEKVITNGGYIVNNNKLLNKKQNKMSEPTKTETATEELIKIEQEIETFLEVNSEKELENTYSQLDLTSKNAITDTTTFATQLESSLGGKINKEIESKIKQLLEKIKNNLKSGKVLSAVYSPPSCTPTVTGTKITIEKSACKAATLDVTIEVIIDDVKVLSKKNYSISADLFPSQDVINALSEFSAGRAFLKGLTTSTETFTPGQ